MQDAGSATRVYCPAAAAAPIERFIAAAAELEERAFDARVVPLAPGARVVVRKDFEVEAFATEHPVPSLGYHLWRKRRRLAPELEGLEGAEIARLRSTGVEVDAETEELLLSYCGDTGPGVFEADARLFESKVLLLELTYVDPDLRPRSREFGHLHLEDLVAVEGRLANQAIVLHHLSRRHRPEDVRRAVDERLPAIAGRVQVWGLGS